MSAYNVTSMAELDEALGLLRMEAEKSLRVGYPVRFTASVGELPIPNSFEEFKERLGTHCNMDAAADAPASPPKFHGEKAFATFQGQPIVGIDLGADDSGRVTEEIHGDTERSEPPTFEVTAKDVAELTERRMGYYRDAVHASSRNPEEAEEVLRAAGLLDADVEPGDHDPIEFASDDIANAPQPVAAQEISCIEPVDVWVMAALPNGRLFQLGAHRIKKWKSEVMVSADGKLGQVRWTFDPLDVDEPGYLNSDARRFATAGNGARVPGTKSP